MTPLPGQRLGLLHRLLALERQLVELKAIESPTAVIGPMSTIDVIEANERGSATVGRDRDCRRAATAQKNGASGQSG